MSDAAIVEPIPGLPKGKADWRRSVTRKRLLDGLMQCVVARGDYQPLQKAIILAAGVDLSAITRHFGSRKLLAAVLARRRPGAVVDALGLSPQARAALSARDEKILAMAVLAGRMLELGE